MRLRAMLTALIIAASGADAAPAGTSLARVEPLPPMCWPRFGHTATLLADGRVLLTGGSAYGAESAVPWAEVFDPTTRSFVPTGAMNVPRHAHVAVALDDGRVLVAGGWRAGYVEATDTAEIWDPASGTFTLTGPMSVPRGSGAAIAKFQDGEVLVLGGTVEGEYGTSTAAIDLFDPKTREFTHWGDLVMSRSDAAVHWLDENRLLVFGGAFRCCSAPAGPARTRGQEVIDTATRTSRRIDDLPFDLGGAEQSPILASHASRLVTSSLGDVFEFDGEWRLMRSWTPESRQSSREVVRLTPDVALLIGAKLPVINLRDGHAEAAIWEPWVRVPAVTFLGPGRALLSGGALTERPVRDAWLITAR